MDCKVTGAFLCLLGFSFNLSAEPFLTRDQNPLVMIQGLPLPASARLPKARKLNWSATYNITNTLNFANTASESILLDYESHEFISSLSYGLDKGWAIRLDVPLIDYGAGFLDNKIDRWHQLLKLPQGSRPYSPDNLFRLNYQSRANTVVNIDQANSSLADIQLGVGKQLISTAAHNISLWITADLPTGDQQNLTGSKKTDLIMQLASEHRLAPDWLIDANLALILPGDSSLNTVTVASHIWSAQTGIEWRAFRPVSLRVQLNGHSAVYPDSGLKLLGSNYQLVFGGRAHLNSCSSFDISTSEDIKVGASPDVSFGLSYRQLTDCY
jgi:hypothetical protein